MVLDRQLTPRRSQSNTIAQIISNNDLRHCVECANSVEELIALANVVRSTTTSRPISPSQRVDLEELEADIDQTITNTCTPSASVLTPSRLWSRVKRCGSVLKSQMAASDKRIDVILLDGSTLTFSVKPRMQGRELFDAVASHLRLKHTESFGLAYQLDGDYFHWLDLDKKVLRQDVSRVSALYFRIRFYYESICCLDDLLAVAFYFLSARNLLTSGSLHCSTSTYFQLVALVLQAGIGDFVDEQTTKLLVQRLSLVPPAIKDKVSHEETIDKIATQHASLSGCSSGTALVRFMDIAQKLPVYGVHLYHVKDKTNSPTVLGICSRGILEYAHGADLCGPPTYFYEWEQLENLFHRDCKFTIEFHQSRTIPSTVSLRNSQQSQSRQPRVPSTPSGTSGQRATTRSWTTPSELVAQSVWYNAVQQHNFYLSREGNRRSVNPLPTMSTIASSIDIDREVSSRLLLKPASSTPATSNANTQQTENENTAATSEQDIDSASSLSSKSSQNQVKIPPGVDGEKLQRYLDLKQRRNKLRENLAIKRQLLRDVCMQEAKLTGELPVEYPLAPGEDRPLLVPTSYTLSTKLLSHSPSTSNNVQVKSVAHLTSPGGIQIDNGVSTIVELESQIELHRQIVNAKLRLAQDKGQPRKIRNQRMKDYQESLNRVTILEEQLRAAFQHQQHRLQQPLIRQPLNPVPLFNRRSGAYVLDDNEPGLVAKDSSSPMSSLSSSGFGGGVSTPSVGSGLLSKAKSLQDCRRLSDGSNSLGGSALSLNQNSVDALATSNGQPSANGIVPGGNTLPARSSASSSVVTSSDVHSNRNYESMYNAFSHSRPGYRSFTAGGDFASVSSPSSNGFPPSRIHSYDTVIPGGNTRATIRGSAAIAKSIDSGFHDVIPNPTSSHDYLPQACRPPLSPVISTPRTAASTPGSPLRCTCGSNVNAGNTPKNPTCHRYQVGQCQPNSARGHLYSVSENVSGVNGEISLNSTQHCVLRKPFKSETSLNRSVVGANDQSATPTASKQAFVATRAPVFNNYIATPEVQCSPLATADDGDSPRDGAAPVRVYARSPWTAKAYVSPRRYSGSNSQQQQQSQQGHNDSSSSLMTPRQFNRANTAAPEFALHSTTSSTSSLSSFAVNSQLATDFSSEMLQWYEEYLPGNHQKQQTGSASNQQPTLTVSSRPLLAQIPSPAHSGIPTSKSSGNNNLLGVEYAVSVWLHNVLGNISAKNDS